MRDPRRQRPDRRHVGFGSIWVTNFADRTVSRVDADTGTWLATIRTGAVGRGIAVGAGSVWVTDEATGTLVQVDPTTNRVMHRAPVGNGAASVVYGDGAVWVANELLHRLRSGSADAGRPCLNTRRPPFDNLRVRRALNYAVDRRKMVELHGGAAVAQPTCQAVPPTVPGHRSYCPYTVDPDRSGEWQAPDFAKARALVAASHTRGMRIEVWTFPFFSKEGHYLVSLLRRLGYRAQLVDFRLVKSYFTKLDRTPTVQAGLVGWFGGRLAADTFTPLGCDFAQNWAHFCDRRFDREVRRLAAEQAADPTAGAALAARLDRQIVDQAPGVPLFTPRFADLTSARVGNYQANTYAASSVLIDQLWVR